MSMEERLAGWTPAAVIEFIAEVSEAMAFQAGVGGRETAGAIVSYLAHKPEHIEPFLNGGIMELPSEWMDGGRLTWHGMNGKIVHPDEVREARMAARKVALAKKDRPHSSQYCTANDHKCDRPEAQTFSAIQDLPPSCSVSRGIHCEGEALVNSVVATGGETTKRSTS